MLVTRPMSKRQADEYIRKNHRHHKPVVMDIFRVAAYDGDVCVGVAQCNHPVARKLTDGKTIEVSRLCTNGDANVCSFLYAKCARIAKEMGYEHIVTYIYEYEPGTSLKASGWEFETITRATSWNVPSRPRRNQLPLINKQRWGRKLI